MKLSKGTIYILLSFILWIIVEFITVYRTRFGEWMSHMPWTLLQYLFIILIFWFFLINRNWNHKKGFILMLIVMYIFEFLWQNYLLLSGIWFIPGSILLIQIWGFLTFIPLWIVNKSFKQHKKLVIFYCTWPILGLCLAFLL